jgi:hypothetical protein
VLEEEIQMEGQAAFSCSASKTRYLGGPIESQQNFDSNDSTVPEAVARRWKGFQVGYPTIAVAY